LAFLDESGFLLIPSIAKSWAPKGCTPILPTAGRWTKLSAISAITVSPKHKRLGLHIRFHLRKNIHAEEVNGYLRGLLRHLRGQIVLLWDSSPIHRAGSVKRFLAKHPRLHTYRFPGYAPELNPDEYVWANLKKALANSIPRDLDHLRQLLQTPLRRLRGSQRLLRSCILASELPWR
jgi:transposase